MVIFHLNAKFLGLFQCPLIMPFLCYGVTPGFKENGWTVTWEKTLYINPVQNYANKLMKSKMTILTFSWCYGHIFTQFLYYFSGKNWKKYGKARIRTRVCGTAVDHVNQYSMTAL